MIFVRVKIRKHKFFKFSTRENEREKKLFLLLCEIHTSTFILTDTKAQATSHSVVYFLLPDLARYFLDTFSTQIRDVNENV